MRNIYFVFLLLPIFSIAQKLEGQKLIDSLLVELPKMKEDTLKVNVLNNLSSQYRNLDINIAKQYSTKAINLSTKLGWNLGIAKSNMKMGSANYFNFEYSNAILYYNKAIKLSTDKKVTAKATEMLGKVYLRTNDYPKALEYCLKALKFYENSNDLQNQSYVLTSIGTIYSETLNEKKSLKYFEKSYGINKKINSIPAQIVDLQNIGTSYTNTLEFNKALPFYFESNKLCDKIGQDYSKTINFYSIARIYFLMKDYEKAISFAEKSLKLCSDSENKMGFVKNYGLLGDIYFEMQKIQNNNSNMINKSLINYSKAILFSKEIGEINELSSNYNHFSKIQKQLGNYKESLEAHEQYVIYKDSVFNADNKETIKNLEDKREIELRDNKLKINQLELNSKEKQKWYLLGGLGLLTVIGGLLFYQSRKRKQVNQKLELLNQNLDAKNLELDQANKAKTRFFGILNHDLRGPVANLVFFLQLQQESPEMLDAESIKRMQDKTMTGAENLLSTMEDILQWSKSQMENFKPQPKNIAVNQLFEDTKKVFSGYLKINFQYENPNNIEVFTDENYLKTIIRNLTSNAINVFINTENPKIIWKAWQEPVRSGGNNISYFSIQDNGPGASQEQFKTLFEDTEITSAKSGLGLYLIRDMAKAINCEISVNSVIGVGTTFTLKI